ncbi:hypothetical protein LINPERPRIM_LOCUS30565 [Linum perenne]
MAEDSAVGFGDCSFKSCSLVL